MTDVRDRLKDLSPERLKLVLRHLRAKGAASAATAAGEPVTGAPTLLPAPSREQEQLQALFPGREIEDCYALSPLQEGMLFHALDAPEEATYHDHLGFLLTARQGLDAAAFRRAFRRVVERHPGLRTAFAWKLEGAPRQVVLRRLEVAVPILDWRALSPAAQERQLAAFLAGDRARPYDLSRPPLMRLTLIRLTAKTWRLVLSSHHIGLDAWSEMVLFEELLAFYTAFSEGRTLELEPPRGFRAYVDWVGRQDKGRAEAFWRRYLEGFSAPNPLAWDRPPAREVARSRDEPDCARQLTVETTAVLTAFARRHRLTINTLLEAAWGLLLSRTSGDRDVVFGTVAAGRPPELPGIESMVGLCANTVPVRLGASPGAEVLPWLRQLQRRGFELRELHWSPLTEVQKCSDVPRSEALFDSALVLVNTPSSSGSGGPGLARGGPLEIQPEHYEPRTNLSLTTMVWPGRALLIRMFYQGSRFDRTTVLRHLELMETLLRGLAAASGSTRLHDLPSLRGAQRQQLLVEWNDTAYRPSGRTFGELLAARVEQVPEAVAVACDGHQVSYRHLRGLAAGLAGRLAERVAAEDVVALLAPRGIEFLAVVLAAFDLGAAYLPLDPKHPPARWLEILTRSRSRLVIAHAMFLPALRQVLEGAPGPRPLVLALEELFSRQGLGHARVPRGGPQSLAYVIYTSGSTGAPKGAMVEHRGMLNHLLAKVEELRLTAADVLAQTASQCFDISVWQFLAPLLVGGRVEVFSDQLALDPARLLDRLEALGVSIFEPVPSVLRAFLEEIARRPARPALVRLRWVIPTGEALPPELCRAWLAGHPRVPLLNAYGPTECSDDITHHRITLPPPASQIHMPIGRALLNLHLWVVDRHLLPVPHGVVGELCAGGGVAVGRGYLRDSGRTAEIFVPDPFAARPGRRMYRTGDLARYLPDGVLEFLGRRDHQVKIRGFRIEPGEVESLLGQHPAVHSAAVVARPRPEGHGELWLVAYFVPESGDGVQVPELRGYLKESLPNYMVPSAFVALEEMPLNRNGKIDRKALPVPEAVEVEGRARPRTPTEELLLEIWRQVLSIEQPALDEPFFDVGGHSLLAVQLISRVRGAFRVELPLHALFDDPTVIALAKKIETAKRADRGLVAPPIERVSRAAPLPLSFAQQRLWVVDQMRPGSPAFNMPEALRVSGRFDVAAFGRALDEIVRRHEALRTTFRQTEEHEPVQVVGAARPVPLPEVDLSALAEPVREKQTRRLAREEAACPFDLEQGPLLRSRLLRLGDEELVILLTLHHIVSDGWSMGVLVNEVTSLYRAFSAGQPSPLPELPIQYGDFACWQRNWLAGEVLERQLAFWQRHLRPPLPVLRLPTDRDEPAVPTQRGAGYAFMLSTEASRGLLELSQREGATLFMTLLTVFKVLLYRLTGQTDLVVGTDVANRNRQEIEPLIGFFMNLLALRTDLAGGPSFREALHRVREGTLLAYDHQDLPFDKLIGELKLERNLGVAPLLDVLFVFQNAPTEVLDLSGAMLRPLEIGAGTSRFNLAFFAAEGEEGLACWWTYRTDLFDRETIARFSASYQALVESVLEDPERCLDDLEILTAAEKERQAAARRQRGRRSFGKFKKSRPRAVPVGGDGDAEEPGGE